jgi:hypothetical protein
LSQNFYPKNRLKRSVKEDTLKNGDSIYAKINESILAAVLSHGY